MNLMPPLPYPLAFFGNQMIFNPWLPYKDKGSLMNHIIKNLKTYTSTKVDLPFGVSGLCFVTEGRQRI